MENKEVITSFDDIVGKEEVSNKICTIVESNKSKFQKIINVEFFDVVFKDCVFNFAQFIKCNFYRCKFINCKWIDHFGLYISSFYCCDFESIPSSSITNSEKLFIIECTFRFCNFKDTKIYEMFITNNVAFFQCRFPYKVYSISNGFDTQYIFPDSDKEKYKAVLESLENIFEPIPDEKDITEFDETKFGYKKLEDKK